MTDTDQQPLNRTQRRRQGRYPTAGRGQRRRAALKALNAALRTELQR